MKAFTRLILNLVLMTTSFNAMAYELPVSKADPSQNGFDSVMECTRAAIKAASEVSTTYEVAGMIYKRNGKYYYTLPVTQGSPHDVDYRVMLLANSIQVGMYHTHPGRDNKVDRFSDNDLKIAKEHGIQMFVGVLEMSHILVYQSKTGAKLDFPMVAQKPVETDAEIESMLKDHNPKDTILQYMKNNAVLWDVARTRVNSVIEQHIAAQELTDMEKKLEML